MELWEDRGFDPGDEFLICYGNCKNSIRFLPEPMQAVAWAQLAKLSIKAMEFIYPRKKTVSHEVSGSTQNYVIHSWREALDESKKKKDK